MGFGGGFLLVPMLIYFLRVPTTTVIGTSNVLTMATMVVATISHAATNHLVDGVLALILMIGGVTGRSSARAPHNGSRRKGCVSCLGLLVLAVGLRFAFEVLARPDDLYSIRPADESLHDWGSPLSSIAATLAVLPGRACRPCRTIGPDPVDDHGIQ